LGTNFLEFNGFVLLVISDVPVDSEAPMTTSSILSRGFAGLVFEGTHRVRVYVRSFIGVSMRAFL
jgi:hypothetical protein